MWYDSRSIESGIFLHMPYKFSTEISCLYMKLLVFIQFDRYVKWL